MQEFIVDSSAFPLVVARWPTHVSEESIDGFFDALTALAVRGPYLLVSDASGMALSRVNATSRVYLAKRSTIWDQNQGKGALLGLGVVLKGPVGKLIMTGYMWMKAPAPYPTELFTDVEAACTWGRGLIKAR